MDAVNTIMGIQREIYLDNKNKRSVEDQLIKALRDHGDNDKDLSTSSNTPVKFKYEEIKEWDLKKAQNLENKQEESAKQSSTDKDSTPPPTTKTIPLHKKLQKLNISAS